MVVILIIAIAVCVGVFFFIKGLVLAKKQNKCKVLFKKYPNAIKVFMLNHDAFASISTHYDRIIGGRVKYHDSRLIQETSCDMIDKLWRIQQCNAILSESEQDWQILENNFKFLSFISEKYPNGFYSYIICHLEDHELQLYANSKIGDYFIRNLKPTIINKLALVTSTTYRIYEDYENSFYDTFSAHNAEAQNIRQYLKEKNIKYFWHFTDIRNINSIIENNGLYSWYSCNIKGIVIDYPGGDDLSRSLDQRRGLEDYVRLSFAPTLPMQYRKECEGGNIVLLKIHPSVATIQTTLFSTGNATSNSSYIGNGLSSLKQIDIDAIGGCPSRDSENFAKNQAEVLVKSHIPLQYILNIHHIENLIQPKKE